MSHRFRPVIGDAHGLNTLEHQPAKIAAIEGHWENPPGEATPLVLFGVPDMDAEKTKYSLEIPLSGKPDSDAQPRQTSARAEVVPERGSPELNHHFLVVQDNGGGWGC
ncbi:terminal oxidase subunit I [Citrobacter koseri]|uniref:Terminal oxidase subunit I n=1 Tax=Citrobacter koseri TaxID=545 RepID=A0A2X2W1Z1_CITKO|nr:terminal oxidase subunit I [Citrobacter koseri]